MSDERENCTHPDIYTRSKYESGDFKGSVTYCRDCGYGYETPAKADSGEIESLKADLHLANLSLQQADEDRERLRDLLKGNGVLVPEPKLKAMQERIAELERENERLRELGDEASETAGHHSRRANKAERERDELKEDLSVNRQCYYEVVEQRNNLYKAREQDRAKISTQLKSLIHAQRQLAEADYSLGILNGLICALSVVTGESPQYVHAETSCTKLPSGTVNK